MEKRGRFTYAVVAVSAIVAITMAIYGCSPGASPGSGAASALLSGSSEVSASSSGAASSSSDAGGASAQESPGASASSPGAPPANDALAVEFMYAFCDDWDFENGEMIRDEERFYHRCLPYIAEGSALYDEFSNDENFALGTGSKWARGAAFHVTDAKVSDSSGSTCVVDVAYCTTQNTLTEEMYEEALKKQDTISWELTFDEDGKITSLEKVEREEQPLEIESDKAHDAYWEKLAEIDESNRGVETRYAFIDLTGDGVDEMMVAYWPSVYTYKAGEAVQVYSGNRGGITLGPLYKDEHVFVANASGGLTYRKWNGEEFEALVTVVDNNVFGGGSYYWIEGKDEVSEDEAKVCVDELVGGAEATDVEYSLY